MERYLFHVHARTPSWRLVLKKDAPRPEGYAPEDWTFTRERTGDDTNPDVKRLCDEAGYCLFKIGGTFADLAAELRS